MRAQIGPASYRNYDSLSRYSLVPNYYNYSDKKEMSGTGFQLEDDTAYVLHKVKQGDSYDSIALQYYNNPTYYWIILDFNRILDPFHEPEVGDLLKVPSISVIAFAR